MTTIIGKLTKWNVVLQVFTLSTPLGDIRINIEKCSDLLLDDFINSMKDRKNVEIKVGE